ncbi:hypothetical protein PTKIN_Ptkin14bG0210700 [Pterospermum kingtungense]
MEGRIWIESEGLGKVCAAIFIVKLGIPERLNESKLSLMPKCQQIMVQQHFPGLKFWLWMRTASSAIIRDIRFEIRIRMESGSVGVWMWSDIWNVYELCGVFNRETSMACEIPSSFCNGSSVGVLDLSNNNLNGAIPQCLGNLRPSVLDLRMNNFSGSIPAEIGECEFLTTLGLNGNKLEGLLPRSLLNCTNPEVLDVGNNKINGEFPHWLGSLRKLQVLVLRSNEFQGPIANPRTKFPFPMLRIMDVSHNEFTGPLPAFYFKNFKAMMTVDQSISQFDQYMGEDYYSQDHMKVTMKGVDIELVRILSILATIDLSNNNFSGEIPANIGKFKSLKGLNFSHNNLMGHIPSSMGSLTNLEWLDLSSNRLAGKVPEELLDITFLEVLNLSYNNLEGQIPLGKQFNTFSNDSYIRNLRLCGFPLLKKCNQQPPPPSFVTSGLKIGFGWKVVALGYGCGVIFGMFMGCLVFSTRNRNAHGLLYY